MLCCGYTLTDFPISIRLTSLALWQSNDCPSASKATLMNMDKYFMWIHYERLHNHNKAKHNKTVCIFLGIYCRFVDCCIWWRGWLKRRPWLGFLGPSPGNHVGTICFPIRRFLCGTYDEIRWKAFMYFDLWHHMASLGRNTLRKFNHLSLLWVRYRDNASYRVLCTILTYVFIYLNWYFVESSILDAMITKARQLPYISIIITTVRQYAIKIILYSGHEIINLF